MGTIMLTLIRWYGLVFFVASATGAFAQDKVLFNGKNLEGWAFEAEPEEKNPKPVDQVWVVQQGLLISTGAGDGFLKYKGEFENYVLTFDWRSMQLKGSGVAASGTGSVFVHASDEMGSFHCPKSIEIGVFNDPGSVYFRDVEPFAKQKWAFRAPDFADEAEKEMGEWNQMKIICRGNRLTVFLNGTPVNQVDGLNRTKGSIVLRSQRASFRAPSYYRNLRVSPLTAAAAQDEKVAAARLAKFKAMVAQQEAAERARQRQKEN
jgi:hypothetical protein